MPFSSRSYNGTSNSIPISQEMFAVDVLTALKSSLEQRRKHVLGLLRLYGDRAQADQCKMGSQRSPSSLNIICVPPAFLTIVSNNPAPFCSLWNERAPPLGYLPPTSRLP